jgi:diaminopimelate epimerase
MVKATYGHGTHNDFVLVFDEKDELKFKRTNKKNL